MSTRALSKTTWRNDDRAVFIVALRFLYITDGHVGQLQVQFTFSIKLIPDVNKSVSVHDHSEPCDWSETNLS